MKENEIILNDFYDDENLWFDELINEHNNKTSNKNKEDTQTQLSGVTITNIVENSNYIDEKINECNKNENNLLTEKKFEEYFNTFKEEI